MCMIAKADTTTDTATDSMQTLIHANFFQLYDHFQNRRMTLQAKAVELRLQHYLWISSFVLDYRKSKEAIK